MALGVHSNTRGEAVRAGDCSKAGGWQWSCSLTWRMLLGAGRASLSVCWLKGRCGPWLGGWEWRAGFEERGADSEYVWIRDFGGGAGVRVSIS